MTKKHLEALARILRDAHTIDDVRNAVANYAAADNPRFDRARFMRAAVAPVVEAAPDPRRVDDIWGVECAEPVKLRVGKLRRIVGGRTR